MYELLSSTVIHGKEVWRTLSFPTINCPIVDSCTLPSGTYRVNVRLDGTIYRGIGPYFAERHLFEIYLLDYNQDCYGKAVTIIPLVYIRENRSFNSLDELQEQITLDVQRAYTHPQTVITFGTFDYFHPGHEAYLREAKQFGDRLITIVARDATVERIKGMLPDHNEQERVARIHQIDCIDQVELWDLHDPYTCLLKYLPQLICLWYDQHSFDNWLRTWCDLHWLQKTQILRLSSVNPEQRKSSQLKKQTMNRTKQRILVWLSWWVDSAVTAAILLEQGYEVIAGFMKNYADETNPHCHTREDRDMALKVAAHLGITTFIIFDFREEYNNRIIQYIYDGYQQGLTPNPDVLCNSLVKFDLFAAEAKKMCCSWIATGHYARIEQHWTYYHLLKWVDATKDQSYFLSGLTQEQLAYAHFPLWSLTKAQVRQKAHELNLPNAERKDSQWLCFIGKVPMKEFLSKELHTTPGAIKDSSWKVLWTHPWALFYTIGQREWIWLSWGPWFVIEKDIKNNELIVGHEDDPKLRSSTVVVNHRQRSWLPQPLPLQAAAKLRYRQPDQPCTVNSSWWTHEVILTFPTAQRAVTPWQIAVLYQGDLLIGQWIIVSAH